MTFFAWGECFFGNLNLIVKSSTRLDPGVNYFSGVLVAEPARVKIVVP